MKPVKVAMPLSTRSFEPFFYRTFGLGCLRLPRPV